MNWACERRFTTLRVAAGDAVPRIVRGLRVVTYNVPHGACAGYYPACNPLLPLWHYAEGSHVPAAKSIPVRIHKRGESTA